MLTSASSFSGETAYDAYHRGVGSSQGADCNFESRGPGSWVKTDLQLVDGETSNMTKDDHFFVGVVRQLLLRKGNVAWGWSEETHTGE